MTEYLLHTFRSYSVILCRTSFLYDYT